MRSVKSPSIHAFIATCTVIALNGSCTPPGTTNDADTQAAPKFALGSGIPTVAIFNCTSPWEIHDYGLLTKIVSPLLEEFFYQRCFEHRATTAVSMDQVFHAVMKRLS